MTKNLSSNRSHKTRALKGKVVIGLILIHLVAIVSIGSVAAAGTTFGQKILPMDCVFETINNGTGTLHYLTPATCGAVLVPPPSDSDISVLPAQPTTAIGRESVSLLLTSPYAADAAVELPWRQIVTQNSTTDHPTLSSPSHVNGVVVAAAAAGILVILALAVFLF